MARAIIKAAAQAAKPSAQQRFEAFMAKATQSNALRNDLEQALQTIGRFLVSCDKGDRHLVGEFLVVFAKAPNPLDPRFSKLFQVLTGDTKGGAA